ncbi:spore germination protein GerW family protein [Streptomyces fulvoviolaceus]|uniref:spore germination protein GerW family protein n=1 Tax=Streptomyces fulvoviolaceus TaxID=285535 RepID=UPI00099731DF|nr:spore germination protein GerW family protein [Streptomyces fulvoviolaceus]
MSESEHDAPPPPAPVVGPDPTVAHPSGTLLDRLAERLGGRASVTVVYGEPVTAHDVTVIPVARVGFGFGGGVVRVGGGKGTGDGGGGGGGVEARPVGYIEMRDGTTVYRPIRDPWVDVVVPLAALVVGTVLPKVVEALRRRK